jgi:hypothetical protein
MIQWLPTVLVVVLFVACSGEVATPAASLRGAPNADEAIPPPGIPDRNADPAVVAIDVGGETLCSGTLVAPGVVVTAHHCVAVTAPGTRCPAAGTQIVGERAPSSLRILVGDDLAIAEERARGLDVLSPPGDELCGADIAMVLLDTPIEDVRPLSVRTAGAAEGDHLRAVGFARLGASSEPQKLVMDHLRVLATTATEFEIGEICDRDSGGPAIDESTGELVGVASRSAGAACAGAGAIDVYTRTDAFFPLIAQALTQASIVGSSTAAQEKTKKGPIDMGASCVNADDCAAGVCVTAPAQEYCSRTCDPHDHCPAHFRCQSTVQSGWVCAL